MACVNGRDIIRMATNKHVVKIYFSFDSLPINISEWLVTDVCHQPIFEKIATASRLSLAKTRKFCW